MLDNGSGFYAKLIKCCVHTTQVLFFAYTWQNETAQRLESFQLIQTWQFRFKLIFNFRKSFSSVATQYDHFRAVLCLI